jgi:hypothetical protein
MAADIAALERLVSTLLSHLERATQPDFTDQIRYRAMISEVHGALSKGEAEG